MTNYKEKTRDSYDVNAPYHRVKFQELADFDQRLDFRTFLDLEGGNILLDLGCGPGYHSAYFMEKGMAVTAIDLSEEMVGIAKEQGVDAQVMDIENMTFDENTFDRVWAATSLLHIPKNHIGDVLQKISYITKPGGVIYISLKEGEGEGFVTDKENPDTQRYFSLWELEEFSKVAQGYFTIEIARRETSVDGKRSILAFYLRNKK